MTGLLTSEEEVILRIENVLLTFARADTTLTGRDIKCTGEASASQVPMWSTDDVVTFNIAEIPISDWTTVEGLIALYGGNYHELSHLRYTPRSGTWFAKRIHSDHNLKGAWNALEDQRIERLMCGKYLACAPYLVAVFMRYILTNKAQPENLYPLAYGRRHLPKRVRQMLKDCYAHPSEMDELERIIDEYLTVVHPKDDAYALRLVQQFADLIARTTPPPDFAGHSNRPATGVPGSSGTNASQQEQQEDATAADQAEAAGKLDAEEGQPEDGKASGEGEESSDEKGTGSSAGKGGGDDEEEIEDAVKKTLDRLKGNAHVSSTIDQTMRSTQQRPGTYDSTLRMLRESYQLDTEDEWAQAAQRFADEMIALYAEVASGWETHQPSGRLNMQRAMQRHADLNTVFDQWRPGVADAFSIDSVILGDLSGSMFDRGIDVPASIAMWVVRRAFELIGDEMMTTTLGYDDDRQVTLMRRGQHTDPLHVPVWKGKGGTDPEVVLNETRQIMAASKSRYKVVFIMTDGDWYYCGPNTKDRIPPEESIRMMNESGVITVLVHMVWSGTSTDSGGNYVYKDHGCLVHGSMVDWFDLITIARMVVTRLLKEGEHGFDVR